VVEDESVWLDDLGGGSEGMLKDIMEDVIALVEEREILTPEHFSSPPNSSRDMGRSMEYSGEHRIPGMGELPEDGSRKPRLAASTSSTVIGWVWKREALLYFRRGRLAAALIPPPLPPLNGGC
jgi:hypothetical protein